MNLWSLHDEHFKAPFCFRSRSGQHFFFYPHFVDGETCSTCAPYSKCMIMCSTFCSLHSFIRSYTIWLLLFIIASLRWKYEAPRNDHIKLNHNLLIKLRFWCETNYKWASALLINVIIIMMMNLYGQRLLTVCWRLFVRVDRPHCVLCAAHYQCTFDNGNFKGRLQAIHLHYMHIFLFCCCTIYECLVKAILVWHLPDQLK